MASKPVGNAGELFTQCQHQYGLAPEDVLGLLGIANTDELSEQGDYDQALARIEELLTLRSGQMLWPANGHASLVESLEQAERKAWRSLRRYRFQEFAHYAELWARLAKISGKSWKNPFGAVAALGRTHDKGRAG